jgi:hypothetical protein
MKIREPYKGHVIEAMSLELRGNLGFVTELFIETHDQQGVTITHFHVPKIFQSVESAIQAAVLAGRHKVDVGFVPLAGPR